VEVVGKPMVLLNSAEAVNELMGNRSAIYSDRPRFPLIDLYASFPSRPQSRAACSPIGSIGQDWNLGFMPYGKAWQTRKTLVLNKYSKHAVQAYRPAAENANAFFLAKVLEDPEHLADHLRL
jgi:hypothetical protein